MSDAARTELRPWFLTLHDLTEPIDWNSFFHNDNPVELDIGCGRGLFLVNAASANREINYLGLEIDFREGRRGAKRLKKRELDNARVLGGDAREALTRWIPKRSVSAIHVYFPDPWWKRKHRRRRLITDTFVDLCAEKLIPGGLLHSWTDVEDYFEVIRALMDHRGDFEPLPPPNERSPEDDMDYQTGFERKRRKAGCTIFRGLWRFQPGEEIA